MPARKQTRTVTFHADGNGCLSRPAFEGALVAALKREPVATLVHVDVDAMLELNEQAGHEAGDRAIATIIASLGASAKKEGWTLGRIGGDEFALLAPGASLEPVFLRADQLRREVDGALAKALPGRRVTVSMGVANTPRDTRGRGPEAANELMRRADLALHAAKEQGRGAVGLTPSDDMVLKSSYYSAAQLGRLKGLAERMKKKEAVLLREALDDLLRKYERS
ncbi:MAG TPA: diguanylate cyclase [Candidatus Limnocylindria bacterium]|nr:diguanylate cyclase [Candidatus Limnocylindria bacterium]